MAMGKWADDEAGRKDFKAGAFKADLTKARGIMATARQYVVDVDRDGKKASKIYDDLDRVKRTMQSYQTDGTDDAMKKQASTMVDDIDEIISHKIGKASRAQLPGQTKAKKSGISDKEWENARKLESVLQGQRHKDGEYNGTEILQGIDKFLKKKGLKRRDTQLGGKPAMPKVVSGGWEVDIDGAKPGQTTTLLIKRSDLASVLPGLK